MNFEESIYPLSEFLTANNFSIVKTEPHFVEYSTSSAVITVAYSNLEYVFYTHVGENSKSLVELTTIMLKEVFGEDSFQFQSTLTIDDLVLFLNGAGRQIVLGDKKIFKTLIEFSERKAAEYTRKLIHYQNTKSADDAWIKKDYAKFIEYIDRSEKELLPESYLKKYKIALDKLQRRTG